MIKNTLTIFFTLLFLPLIGQNTKFINEFSVDISRKYSNFKEINSLKEFDLYANAYLGEYDISEFGLLIVHNENSYVVIFQKLEQPYFRIIDFLLINKQKNCYLQSMVCSINDEINPEIISLALIEKEDFSTQEFHKNIILAWRLNRKNKKIENIEPENIKCYNEGYGV